MKIAIGTAQFGLDYGISNSSGKTNITEIKKILDYAALNGIDTIDTASAYGNAQTALGHYGINNWKCISKIRPIPSDVSDIKDWVLQEVEDILNELNIKKLYGILLHQPKDIIAHKDGYIRALLELKEKNKIINIGYSIYSPNELNELTNILWPDIVQVPYNVFDKRIIESGWMKKLKENNTEIHARSIFLQGLLLMPSEKRPIFFDKWKNIFLLFEKELKLKKLSPLSFSLNYVMQNKYIDKAIIGINNLNQLKDITNCINLENDISSFFLMKRLI